MSDNSQSGLREIERWLSCGLLLCAALLTSLPSPAFAACDGSGDPVTVSVDCYDLSITGNKTNVTIKSSATISSLFTLDSVLVGPSGNVTGTFLNQGTITADFGHNALTVQQGSIATLTNEGLITNARTGSMYGAIVNNGDIGTLNNSGSISATEGSFGSGAHALIHSGHIGLLNNSGLISAQNSAIYLMPGISSRIDSILNTGTIQGGIAGSATSTFASAIVLGGGNSIGTIVNVGVIDHSVCDAGGTCYAAIENRGGSIDTITNLGILTSGNTGNSGYGIINGVTGHIGTLNNDQQDLTYFGVLPDNYMAIIYGASNYGKLIVTNASGVMNFTVDAAAPIGTSVYTSVLSGVAEGNLAATSGSWGGGLFDNTWVLTSTTPSQWDLQVTSRPIVPSVEESPAGQALAVAIQETTTDVASGLLPPDAPIPVLANGVTLQQAAQGLTQAQVNQFAEVNAEGYSSNLTIGLQQMGMISEAVTDRIYARSTDFNASHSRSIWADASGSRGRVDGYNGLSGFDYNLYNMIVGGDIIRKADGGLGVFAGIGYANMSESDDVPQEFDTVSYLVGLYGGREFASDIRLSASAGYIYGQNEATRHNRDIGQFTGGTARSDYGSNGAYGAVKLAKAMTVNDSITVSPFVGASYSQLWMNEAKESGGGDFNYTISSATAYTTVLFLGSDLAIPLSGAAADGLAVIGFVKLGYDMFADDDDAHRVTANSDIYGSFEQVGADMGPFVSNFGLGITGSGANGLAGRIGVVGALNTNGYQFGLGGELRW